VGIDRATDGRAPTGVFFTEQTTESVCEAILRFEEVQIRFDPIAIQEHAARFSRSRFEHDFGNLVSSVIAEISAARK
jgi:hypothetical protein